MTTLAPADRQPGLLDTLDLVALRLAKRRRGRFRGAAEFYEGFFTDEDVRKVRGDVRTAWRFGLVRRTYRRLFPGGADVVDVGCGLGVLLLYLPPNARFIGIDISERALAAARAYVRHGAEFRSGGFPCLPVESESCDFAVCLEVLEHLDDDARAVRELHRVLRPGGYLLLSVPNTYYWSEYRSLIGHLRHYTAQSLTDLLAGGGFAVVDRLPQFTRFWRAYHYLYIALRGVEFVIRHLGWSRYSIYDSAAYRRLARAMLLRLEARADEMDASSTLVLCRRAVA